MVGPAKSRVRWHIEKSKEWVTLYKNTLKNCGKKDESFLHQAIYHMMVAQKTVKEIENE